MVYWNGWKMAKYPSYAFTAKRKLSRQPKIMKKNLRNAPNIGHRLLLSLYVHEHFWNCDRWKGNAIKSQELGNKYLAIWRQESSLISRIISKFPRTVVRYMSRNRAKNVPCCFGQVGSPKRRTWDKLLWFSLFMLFLSLLAFGETGEFQWICHNIIRLFPWRFLILAKKK